jgi:hypothetical protein
MTDAAKDLEKKKKHRVLVTQEIVATERTYVSQVSF